VRPRALTLIVVALALSIAVVLVLGTMIPASAQQAIDCSKCVAHHFKGLRGGWDLAVDRCGLITRYENEFSGHVCGDPMTAPWQVTWRAEGTGGRGVAHGRREQHFSGVSPDREGLLNLPIEPLPARLWMYPQIRIVPGATPQAQLSLRPPAVVRNTRVTPTPPASVPVEQSRPTFDPSSVLAEGSTADAAAAANPSGADPAVQNRQPDGALGLYTDVRLEPVLPNCWPRYL
jgi:hypothetical protein